MRSKNRTTRAVKDTIRAFKEVEARVLEGQPFINRPYYDRLASQINLTSINDTPEMQQLRSNRCGSAFYQKICPSSPMTSAQIKAAFAKKAQK